MTESLIVERRGATEWLTLNRPARLNALDGPLIAALADRFASLRDDDSVRAVVLRGAGRGFCSGLDLKTGPSRSNARDVERLPEVILAMRQAPQPIVALLHGAACGGGFALALAADIRIAGRSAHMSDGFVTLGLSGCELGLSWFLPRTLGLSVAAELMMTGRFLLAERAERLSLVSELVEDDRLETTATALLDEMLQATPLGLRMTKETLLGALQVDDLETVIKMEAETQAACMRGTEFRRRIRAFGANS